MKATATPKPEPVARLYAKALFELASENGQLDVVATDLGALVELVKSSGELEEALTGLSLSVETREKLVQGIAEKGQLNPLVARLATLLVAKSRMSALSAVDVAFRGLIDISKNTLRGQVTTAEPLTEAEASGLSKAFGKKFSKNVVLDPVIDKEILGGLIVQVQGLTFDGSLKNAIRRLKENLERQTV